MREITLQEGPLAARARRWRVKLHFYPDTGSTVYGRMRPEAWLDLLSMPGVARPAKWNEHEVLSAQEDVRTGRQRLHDYRLTITGPYRVEYGLVCKEHHES